VKFQMMEVTISVLKEANERLNQVRVNLQEEKVEAEQKREELRTQVKAADDVA